MEDDDPIRLALEVSLVGEGYLVRAQRDGRNIERLRDLSLVDLAILDVRLPCGPDGHALARMLSGGSDVPLLFLTAADTVEDRLAGFSAGGDDYLVKPFAMAELLARVSALLRRSGRSVRSTWEIDDLVVDDAARLVRHGGQLVSLTRTEYDLLLTLVQNTGRILSKTQLLTQVWGFDAYDDNLVEVHVSALRRKLEAAGPRVRHRHHLPHAGARRVRGRLAGLHGPVRP